MFQTTCAACAASGSVWTFGLHETACALPASRRRPTGRNGTPAAHTSAFICLATVTRAAFRRWEMASRKPGKRVVFFCLRAPFELAACLACSARLTSVGACSSINSHLTLCLARTRHCLPVRGSVDEGPSANTFSRVRLPSHRSLNCAFPARRLTFGGKVIVQSRNARLRPGFAAEGGRMGCMVMGLGLRLLFMNSDG